jgi:hypothetical protein
MRLAGPFGSWRWGLLVFTKNHVSALFPSEKSSTAVNNHHMNSNTMTPPHFTHALPVAYLFSCFGFWRGYVLETR